MKVIWYIDEIIGDIPIEIYADKLLWTACISLICFEDVKWHQIDWVTRQFGFTQGIPQALVDIGPTHNYDIHGWVDTN